MSQALGELKISRFHCCPWAWVISCLFTHIGKSSYIHAVLKDIDGRTFNSLGEGREKLHKAANIDPRLEEVHHMGKTQRVGNSGQRKQCKGVENKRLWSIYRSTDRALHPDSTWVQSKEWATLLSSGPRPILTMRVHSKHTPCSANPSPGPALVTTPTGHCGHNWPFPVMFPLLMGLVASFQHFALVQAWEIECFLNPCSNIYVSGTSTWAQGFCLVLASSMNQKSSTISEPGLVRRL